MSNSQCTKANGELVKLLKAFFSVRGIEVSADGLRLWMDAFAGMSPQAVETAIRRFNREGTEYPIPAAVRRYAGIEGLSDEQRADVAWAVVRKTILKYGAWYAVNFDDPITNATVRNMGGWERVCDTPSDGMAWKQKEFVRAYTTILRSGTGDCRPLGGILGFDAEQADISVGLPPHEAAKTLTMGSSMSAVPVAIPDLSVGRKV